MCDNVNLNCIELSDASNMHLFIARPVSFEIELKMFYLLNAVLQAYQRIENSPDFKNCK